MRWGEKKMGLGGHGEGVVTLRAQGSFWFGKPKDPWAHIPQYLLIQFGPAFSTLEIFALAWCLRQRRDTDKNGLIECSGRFKDSRGFKLETIAKQLSVSAQAVELALEAVCSGLGGELARDSGLVTPRLNADALTSRFDPAPETHYLMQVDIRDVRKRAGLSLRETAVMLGVSHETFRRWESGVVIPTGAQLEKIRSWRSLILKEEKNHSDIL